MKVKDLIKKDIDVDVYDNICEELGVAFVGPLTLTPEGKTRFADVLNLDVNLSEDYAIVQINEDDDWRNVLNNACIFFNSAAGYCSNTNYRKWFKEV